MENEDSRYNIYGSPSNVDPDPYGRAGSGSISTLEPNLDSRVSPVVNNQENEEFRYKNLGSRSTADPDPYGRAGS